MTTTRLFVYGTLKSGYGNNRLLRTSRFAGEAISEHPKFKMTGHGVPFLSDKGDQYIRGELWEIDDPDVLDRIDQLEGHPTCYCRREHSFYNVTTGERETAWVYLRDFESTWQYDGTILEWPYIGEYARVI